MALSTSSGSAPASNPVQKSASDQLSDADDEYWRLLSAISFGEMMYHDMHMRIHDLDEQLRRHTTQCRLNLLLTLFRENLAVHMASERDGWTRGMKDMKLLKDKVSARGHG